MKRIFYGWYMVAAGSALQFLQSSLLMQSFGAYVAVLRDDRGWSKTALSGAAALHQMEAATLGPVLGWIIDRFGPQGLIRIGVVVFGVGFMLFSQVETLLEFYGAFIVMAIGSSFCGFFPVNVALIHWFERWRARALSSLSLGLALGGIFVPVIAWSLAAFGWRATAFASAAFVIPLMAVGQMGGVGVGWLVGDRFEKRLVAATCMLMHMTGLLLLTYAVALPMLIAFAALHGVAWGLRGPFMQAIRADYFGRAAIGMILGLSYLIIVVGQVGGPMIAGITADATGDYRAGFTILALLAGTGSFFFLLARRPSRPLRAPGE